MSGNWLDLSNVSNRYIQTYMKGFLDMSGGNLLLRNNNILVNTGDISLGGRFFVNSDISANGNLYVANYVNIGVSGNYFNLDVNGNINLRGVVNPITFTDGSVLLTNSAPLDFSNNFGKVWTQVATTQNWYSVAISACPMQPSGNVLRTSRSAHTNPRPYPCLFPERTMAGQLSTSRHTRESIRW
jgi:hypothetical protein